MAHLLKVGLFIALLNVLLFMIPNAVRADDLCETIIKPQFDVPCNSHMVVTADKFRLGIYNIPRPNGIPVLLQHGYTAAGDNWVLNNRQQSLGTYLYDAGFDVWIGNNRNVQWSNGSSKYSTSDPGYWDWTWDELAQFDVTALIQYVFNSRKQRIFYVGHSQGTLTFFAALTNNATQTKTVSSQLRGAMLLAPIIYISHITAPLTKNELELFDDVVPGLMGGPRDTRAQAQLFCSTNALLPACAKALELVFGPNCCVNQTRIPYYTMYFPQLTSNKNYNHYGQVFRSGLFQKYNRNSSINLEIYGQANPPLYNFTLFPKWMPVQYYTGGVDGLADPEDVQHALDNLPSTNREVINYPNYGHLDFVIGTQTYVDVYPKMTAFMRSH